MSQRVISQIKENTKIAETILFKILNSIKPGISTYEVDRIAEKEFKNNNVLPATKFLGLKNSISIAINEEVLFGEISKVKKIKESDVVKIGLGIFNKGYFADLAFTIIAGEAKETNKKLIKGTASALSKVIPLLKSNVKIYDVSNLIEATLKNYNLKPICEITGHGIGRNLHQPPSIPNCKNLSFIDYNLRLKENDIVCIEPIASTGEGKLLQKNRGRFITKDKKPTAHFETPILIKKNGAEILSKKCFKFIRELTEI